MRRVEAPKCGYRAPRRVRRRPPSIADQTKLQPGGVVGSQSGGRSDATPEADPQPRRQNGLSRPGPADKTPFKRVEERLNERQEAKGKGR